MTTESDADDRALVRAMAEGRAEALGQLYDRHGRRCYAFALRMLGGERDAGAVVEETFVRAWREAPTRDPGDDAGRWLLALTRELCIEELRRRRERLAPREAARPPAATEVRAALQSLRSNERSTLELVYFHGLSAPEVARLVGVPVATVRERLRAALQGLGHALRRGGVMQHD